MPTAAPMHTLHAGVLVLEPMVAAHAAALFPLLRDPTLYTWLDEPPPPSLAHLQQVYARREARQSPDGRQRWLNWAIRHPAQGLVGCAQATVMDNGSAWLAYLLGRAHWGQGHGTQAMRRVVAHLRDDHGVTRVLATVEQDNARSIGLLLRLGLQPAAADEAGLHNLTATERLFIAATAALPD